MKKQIIMDLLEYEREIAAIRRNERFIGYNEGIEMVLNGLHKELSEDVSWDIISKEFDKVLQVIRRHRPKTRSITIGPDDGSNTEIKSSD